MTKASHVRISSGTVAPAALSHTGKRPTSAAQCGRRLTSGSPCRTPSPTPGQASLDYARAATQPSGAASEQPGKSSTLRKPKAPGQASATRPRATLAVPGETSHQKSLRTPSPRRSSSPGLVSKCQTEKQKQQQPQPQQQQQPLRQARRSQTVSGDFARHLAEALEESVPELPTSTTKNRGDSQSTTASSSNPSPAECGPASELDAVKALFAQFDYDDRGFICRYQLKAVLTKILGDTSISDKDVDHFMEEADKNRNGVIDFNEFFSWLTTPTSSVYTDGKCHVLRFDFASVVRPLFDVFDKDGSGQITKAEFEDCFCILSNAIKLGHVKGGQSSANNVPSLTNLSSTAAFNLVDQDRNGVIDFDEFVAWQKVMLEHGGLLREDLEDFIPALARQLRRVLKLSEKVEKGEVGDEAHDTLQRIIDNIATFAFNAWSESGGLKKIEHAGSKVHYTNRWSEPPVGLNVDRLRRQHLCHVKLPIGGRVKEWDMNVYCVPTEDDNEGRLDSSTKTQRKWLACVQSKYITNAGKHVSQPVAYYEFADLGWHIMHDTPHSEASEEFDKAVESLPPELRMFCLLKTDANFGTKLYFHKALEAMRVAVERNFITDKQLSEYKHYVESNVRKLLRDEGITYGMREGSAEEKNILHRYCANLSFAPREVMAAFSELGIYKPSSVWADFMDS